MQAAAKSVFYFGIYLFLVGIPLLIIPQLFFDIFKLGTVLDVWIRVVGVMTLGLAYYYIQAARHGLIGFYQLTVVVRVGVFLVFLGLVLFKLAPTVLILFGTVDLAGALWTWKAGHKSSQ